ncbi:efflux RND transporter periplasmic adaptor subunit [Pontibacter sp. G13]|uniref:efflux RND transporter periplasmic adaptor subunit n=1 Tax=Pontibacter sp. G13 TaxID=3074898 RepID=UPI0028891ADB|nr:efflux RND transporter periplasmic adaptor subunit [Pontibacter sp. G13]WNJ17429.1 efflux RND transporter periplasmic adaptor subunit [Pontibacter sp. G13]
MAKNILRSVVAASVLLAGCAQSPAPIHKPESSNPKVRVASARLFQGNQTLSYSGLVEAKEITPLSFVNGGTVESIRVAEGQSVKRGQLLAKVNDANASNALQIAQVKLAQAQDAYDRLKPMHENGTLPEIKWVEVETGLLQAQAATEIAKKSQADSKLYAPASGVIGRKNILPGMNMLPGATAFELMDLRTVYLSISVPENEIGLYQKGEDAKIQIEALGLHLQGEVQEIGVSADMLSRTYPIKIEVKNPDGKIKPGMVGTAQLSANRNTPGLLIPTQALQQDEAGGQFVFIAEGKTARKRSVKTISLVGNEVLVSGDLVPNDELIVAGQQRLRAGSPVEIIR